MTDPYQYYPHARKAMTRADIVARGIISVDDDIKQDGAARYLFAWNRDYLLYHGTLDKDHWLHSLIRHLNDEELVIEPVNECHQAQFQGDWLGHGAFLRCLPNPAWAGCC